MSEEIDYAAMVERLQQELLEARQTILKLRYARNPLDHLDADKIRKFVQQNYLVLLLGIMLFEVIYKLIFSLVQKKGGPNGRAS